MANKDPFWDVYTRTFIAGPTESDGFMMTGEHAHLHYEFMINFCRIPIRHTVSGQEYVTDHPYILYRAPYVLHSSNTLTTAKYRRYLLTINPTVLTEYGGICSLGRLRGRAECMIPVNEQQLARLIPILQRLWRARNDTSVPKSVWVSLLSCFLFEINELIPDDLPDISPTPPYIQELMHYVVEHLEEDLRVEVLAEKFFVSRTKLITDFRAATRISLHRYVVGIRTAQARIWLAQGLSVTETAQRCGFSQESAFIHMFRRETGMTPGEWKRRSGM
ncbi:MAG: helix-turn-helix transcriptional regulator [Ruminococcaceae bacterium]|nr:helix-turn-helix transcriptional regulator [Oscillospiraceae bacterium]